MNNERRTSTIARLLAPKRIKSERDKSRFENAPRPSGRRCLLFARQSSPRASFFIATAAHSAHSNSLAALIYSSRETKKGKRRDSVKTPRDVDLLLALRARKRTLTPPERPSGTKAAHRRPSRLCPFICRPNGRTDGSRNTTVQRSCSNISRLLTKEQRFNERFVCEPIGDKRRF